MSTRNVLYLSKKDFDPIKSMTMFSARIKGDRGIIGTWLLIINKIQHWKKNSYFFSQAFIWIAEFKNNTKSQGILINREKI